MSDLERARSFISTARQQSLISVEQAELLLKLCSETGRPAEQLAIEHQMLSHPDIQSLIETHVPMPEVSTASPAAAANLSGGQRFGRYERRSMLGEGGCGTVLEAYDPLLGRLVALKILSDDEQSRQAFRRFELEGRALAKLCDHPNLLQVYDMGTEQGVPFIAMELVKGGSLESWLAAKPRSLQSIVNVIRQVALALGHAHAHGIVHRDVKPQNILMTEQGKPLVADFGLARDA